MRCCVPGCGQRSEKGISFHKYPRKEPDRVKEWVDAVSKFLSECNYEKKRFAPKPNDVICSKHFDSNDHIWVQDGRPMLKNSACPSIFLCDPNARRRRRSKECVANLVSKTLRRIAPKQKINNTENNIATKSSLPESLDTILNSDEPALSTIGIDEIDFREPDCTRITPTRKISKAPTPASQNRSERKSNSSRTPGGFDLPGTTQFRKDVSENCAGCSILRCENETLKEKIIALKELVATLREGRECSRTLSRYMETVTNEATSPCKVEDVFCSTLTGGQVLDNAASDGQDSLLLLQKAVALDHRYESTPRTLKKKLQSSESQKKMIIKRARFTARKLKRTRLKVDEMKRTMKALVDNVNLRPEVATRLRAFSKMSARSF